MLCLAIAALAIPAGASADERGGGSPLRAGHGVRFSEVGDLAPEYVSDTPPSPKPRHAQRRNGRTPRVIGGRPVGIEQVPWQIALTTAGSGGAERRQICGGTLVAPTIVLTAAHCAYESGGFAPARNFGVVSGRTRLSSSTGVEQPVKAIYVPTDASGRPLYDNRATTWDVVVLELPGPASGTPIHLAGADEAPLWAPGQPAYVSGWGSLSSGNDYPDDLHAAGVSMIADSACSAQYGRGYRSTLMVCASGRPADTCPGDSGGPLVVTTADGTPRLVGDTSFGSNRCGTTRASVYGRLAGDPMRSYLQALVAKVAGVDIVGAGGAAPPGPGPTQPPSTTLSRSAASTSALASSKRACYRDRYCRRYGVLSCRSSGTGFRCSIVNLDRSGRRRVACTRTLALSGSDGAVDLRALTRWRCVHGWRLRDRRAARATR